ncbi:Non-structural maintenance of chromosomes element 1 [Allomyces javanicus]|nr:Non-structural maintenance of chromosomes element 1 [Allomyces javanicus]
MADEPQQNLRRLLVQSWMRRPFLLEEEAVALYQRCCTACELPFNAAELPTVVQQINQGLDQFNLMIHFVEHHTRPVSYYILYNSQADEPSQLATTLKPIEIQVFSTMIGVIAQAPGGQASSMDLLNEVPANKGITKRGFEDQVMSKLVDDGWLEKTTPGVYTLGLRTLTELRRYLDAQYADLPKCGRCANLVLMPVACPTGDAQFHRRCLETIAARGRDPACPTCREKIPLPGDLYPAIAAAGAGRRSKRARIEATQEHNDDDDDENEHMDEGVPPPPLPPPGGNQERAPLPLEAPARATRSSRRAAAIKPEPQE